MQRFFDIMLTAISLLLLLPIIIPIILLLRLTGEGEVFYVQERIGKDRRSFGLLKFATMLKDSPNIGTGTITILNDPRVLPLGSFLRRSKINELPQLLNVLKGDMSLIGPRPLTKDRFCDYDLFTQKTISSVRPGLSGVGSIVFRSEDKLLKNPNHINQTYREIIMPFKGDLEKWYVENESLKMYFSLIIVTIMTVVAPSRVAIWTYYPTAPRPEKNLLELLEINDRTT